MLAFLIAYALLQILIGLWMSRRVRGSSDFFVAGRGLGPGLLFSTMLAANIGAGSTIGAAGLGFRDGISAWWWVGSAAIGSIVLALWIGPRIRRVSAEHDLRTVGDYLELRYDSRVRGLVALLLSIGTLAILAGQLIALSWLLNVVTGLSKAAGCLVGGVVVTTYFAAGGLLTSARVNVLQLSVKLLGFALALPLALAAAGGVTGILAATPHPSYWDIWQSGGSGWKYLAMLGPAFVVSPGLLQKIYGARDDRAVKRGVMANALALLTFAIVPPLLGMAARTLHPSLANHELALPSLLMHDLPPVVGALGLAALFSAELSAADAVLFMLSTSLSQDLYRRFLNRDASDARLLTVARLAAISSGAIGVSLAIMSPTVISALSVFYTLLGVSLFVPIVAGLYVKRVRTPDALAAILTGMVGMLAVEIGTSGRGIFGLTPAMVGLACACLGCATSLLVNPEPRMPERQTMNEGP